MRNERNEAVALAVSMEKRERVLDSLLGFREEALVKLKASRFPYVKSEEWKYTNASLLSKLDCFEIVHRLNSLAGLKFDGADGELAICAKSPVYTAEELDMVGQAVRGVNLPESPLLLVYCNGHLVEDFSRLESFGDAQLCGGISLYSLPKMLCYLQRAETDGIGSDETVWNALSEVGTARLSDGASSARARDAVLEVTRLFLESCRASSSPLVKLQSALLGLGCVLHVEAGFSLSCPVNIIHVVDNRGSDCDESDEGDENDELEDRNEFERVGALANCRAYPFSTIVSVGIDAHVAVNETFVDLGSAQSLTLPSMYAKVGDNASCRYGRIQNQRLSNCHFSSSCARLERDSRFEFGVCNLGSLVTRNEITAHLCGCNSNATISGLTLLNQNEHCDNHVTVSHEAEHCESRQLFKGIFGDESRGVFTGTIFVDQVAQKTNAYQTNRSLLLSDRAASHSRPQLKIFADDVKCSHGATVGQLDTQALFYLRSRGIPENEAKQILIKTFLAETLSVFSDAQFVERLEESIEHKVESIL